MNWQEAKREGEKIQNYHGVKVGEVLGEDVVLAESMDKHEQADDGYEHGGEGAAGGLASDEGWSRLRRSNYERVRTPRLSNR